jgi:uncharacterized protein (UPF0264 family)
MSIPKLLVSVRSVAEAKVALGGNIDLLDVKEPRKGSLGAAEFATICQIAQVAFPHTPVSVALGELLANDATWTVNLPPTISYAKIGLANCASVADWPNRWRHFLSMLPRHVRPVAVIYADKTSLAPPAHEIIELAEKLGCSAILIDTYDKLSGTLLDHRTAQQVGDWVGEIQHKGLPCVLAGSVSVATLPQLVAIHPDYLAVRGAVCTPHRSGDLDAARLKQFRAQLTRFSQCPTSAS